LTGGRVASGIGVKVGSGVNVSVGGNVAVAVGIAACVAVIASHAFATAVFAKSSALKVGSGAGPQADISMMTSMERMVIYLLFICSPFSIFTMKQQVSLQVELSVDLYL
jgi:hypothetical protein